MRAGFSFTLVCVWALAGDAVAVPGKLSGATVTSLPGASRTNKQARRDKRHRPARARRSRHRRRLRRHPAVKLPRDPLARGRALLHSGRPARAARVLRRALRSYPELTDYVEFRRGEALLASKAYLAAAKAFQRAASFKGSRWVDRALEEEARALRRGKRCSKAERSYRALLDSFPDHPRVAELWLGLGLCQTTARRARQRQEGIKTLLKVWLEWPASEAAGRAVAALKRLRRRGARWDAPSAEELIERARRLRRTKAFDQAIDALQELHGRERKLRDTIELQLALTHRKAGRPEEALKVFEAIDQRARRNKEQASWMVRRLRADMQAWTGQIQEAVKSLLLDDLRREESNKTRGVRRERLYAVKVLADFGRYRQALAMLEPLAEDKGMRRRMRHSLAWLAYRAGKYDVAAQRFAALSKERRADQPFLLYWQARAQQKAGRAKEAEALYQKVLEEHLRTYYGHLARTRLHEMGKLKIEAGRCDPVKPATWPDVEQQLTRLLRKYGELVPDLKRALALWRGGDLAQARRELRVVAMDLTRALYRRLPLQYRFRDYVARLWRGAPEAPSAKKRKRRRRQRRTLSRRERRLRGLKPQQRDALLAALGPLYHGAGLSYLGWRFSPPDDNYLKRYYPRAFDRLVAAASKRFKVDPNLLWAIMKTESAYRPDAISRVYAGGLMQLMPHTAKRLARELELEDFTPEQVFDPEINITLATHYLRGLWDKFDGQLPLIAAAYNGGPHNVGHWLDFRGNRTEMDEFVEEIPFRESRRYAKKIVRLMGYYERAYCNKDDRIVSNAVDTEYAPQPDF